MLCSPSDPTSQLMNEDEEQIVYGEKVDMADNYQQTELYQETSRQLEEIWQQLQEREERKNEPRARSASYATNIFWQVHVHMHVCSISGQCISLTQNDQLIYPS